MIAQWLELFGLPTDRHDKPRIAVSACLLGDAVRYDGDDKRDALVSDTLAPFLDCVRVCPEVGIGLPVPRPPIQVVALETGHRVQRVDQPSLDYTEALRAHAEQLATTTARTAATALDGFILKARSPSCGAGNTPVHDPSGRELHTAGNGAFADALLARRLAAPLVNESHLQTRHEQQRFLMQATLHQVLRRDGRLPRSAWLDACKRLPGVVGEPLSAWLAQLIDPPGPTPMLQSSAAVRGAQ